MYQYIVQFRKVCVTTTQINSTMQHIFLSCQPLAAPQILSPTQHATLFITLIKHLISQTRAFQVLVSESSK